jgi:hypothetical protein
MGYSECFVTEQKLKFICFEDNKIATSGGVMKKIVRFYYRCSFKVCLCAFYSLIALTVLSSSAFAEQYGDFTYTVSGSTVTITGFTSCQSELTPTAVIPDTCAT